MGDHRKTSSGSLAAVRSGPYRVPGDSIRTFTRNEVPIEPERGTILAILRMVFNACADHESSVNEIRVLEQAHVRQITLWIVGATAEQKRRVEKRIDEVRPIGVAIEVGWESPPS